VERIEVVSGPGSVLYGANAQGAVVNVITKSGQNSPFFVVYQEVGEAQYTKTSFTGGAGGDTYKFYLNGSYSEQGDWPDSKHNSVNYTDYRKKNIFGRLDYYPKDQTSLNLTFSHSDGQEWFHYRDPAPWTMYSHVEPGNTMFAASISNTISVNSTISFNLSYADRNHEDKTWYMSGRPDQGEPNFFTTMGSETLFGDLRYSYSSRTGSWLEQRLTLGGSYDHTEYSGDWLYKTMFGDVSLSKDNADDVRAFYVQEELDVTRYVHLILGVRYDEHPNFDGEFSPRVGVSTLLKPWLTIYSSYNESFRVPGFSDRYGLFFANPDLEPEKGKTVEFGIKSNIGKRAKLNIVYYDSEYDDMIQADMAEMLYKNIGEANISGWEGSLALTPTPHIALSGSFNIREAKDKIHHTELMGMPENIYVATLSLKKIYGFNLSTVYQHVDKRYGDEANSFFAPAYNKVDLKVSYTFKPLQESGSDRQVDIYMGVDNLFNEDDVQAWFPGYHQPGRMIWGGIKFRWSNKI
jgi:outer membrane receptor protein involved in Fe transport